MHFTKRGGIVMKKLIAPFAVALAICGQVLAQSATDSQERSAGQSGQSSVRQGAAGQASAARQTTQSSATTRQGAGAQSSTTGAQGAQQGGKLDQKIATCLALGNQEEVALAQFAQDKAQNPQVKQFAQMMIEEHQQALSQLQQANPQLASLNLELQASTTSSRSPGGASTASASGRAVATASDTNATAGADRSSTLADASSSDQRGSSSASPAGPDQQEFQLARDIKQECLSLTQAELGRKQGADFDKAYIGQQLVAHTQMLAELRASQRHASSRLQPWLQQGTQMTEHHLAQARTIMEQLKQSEGAGGQQPQTTQRTEQSNPSRR
jgi:predicted outer membrane protein